MIRAAAYARFSSDNQRDESIDAQLRAIHKFAAEKGYQIVEEYIDRAKTGTNDRREEFQRMIRDSDTGDFEVVIVHKLDRFARKRYDSAVYRKALSDNGVKLISVLEQFSDTPEGIIFEGMSEAMSEYYSANLSREVKKAILLVMVQRKRVITLDEVYIVFLIKHGEHKRTLDKLRHLTNGFHVEGFLLFKKLYRYVAVGFDGRVRQLHLGAER